MWPDNFWTDNFWTDNFWSGSSDVSTPNIILIDGYTNFNITVDSETPLPRGRIGGRFTCPIQDSYGGLIRLEHNFPYVSGNTAVVGYETPDGEFGEIPASSFDAQYVKAIIPEGLLDTEGLYWKFNIVISGTNNGIPFSIRSSVLKIKVLDGLIDEENR